jgi:hypothetical protein
MNVDQGDRWQYRVEKGQSLEAKDLDRQCNELGAQGWELTAVIPIARHQFGGNGETSSIRLFFRRRAG